MNKIYNGQDEFEKKYCIAKVLGYEKSRLQLELITVPTESLDKAAVQLRDKQWMDDKSEFRIVRIKTTKRYATVDETGVATT